jgi:hypothetical protein
MFWWMKQTRTAAFRFRPPRAADGRVAMGSAAAGEGAEAEVSAWQGVGGGAAESVCHYGVPRPPAGPPDGEEGGRFARGPWARGRARGLAAFGADGVALDAGPAAPPGGRSRQGRSGAHTMNRSLTVIWVPGVTEEHGLADARAVGVDSSWPVAL